MKQISYYDASVGARKSSRQLEEASIGSKCHSTYDCGKTNSLICCGNTCQSECNQQVKSGEVCHNSKNCESSLICCSMDGTEFQDFGRLC